MNHDSLYIYTLTTVNKWKTKPCIYHMWYTDYSDENMGAMASQIGANSTVYSKALIKKRHSSLQLICESIPSQTRRFLSQRPVIPKRFHAIRSSFKLQLPSIISPIAIFVRASHQTFRHATWPEILIQLVSLIWIHCIYWQNSIRWCGYRLI